MASTLIGRTACPECGHARAQVKRSEREGAKPYRWCPECQAQYFAKTPAQGERLIASIATHEPIEATPTNTSAAAVGPAPERISAPVPAAAKPAQKEPAGLFSSLFRP